MWNSYLSLYVINIINCRATTKKKKPSYSSPFDTPIRPAAALNNQGRRFSFPGAGSAAHGGSRHEAKSVSTKYDGVCTVKKSPSPATGTRGHEYVLYHVNQLHIASAFARWVCDLPGEICCFLRPAHRLKLFQKILQKEAFTG